MTQTKTGRERIDRYACKRDSDEIRMSRLNIDTGFFKEENTERRTTRLMYKRDMEGESDTVRSSMMKVSGRFVEYSCQ